MFYDCRWQLQCPISPWEFWRFLGGFRRSRNCHHPLICVFVWMYDVLMCSWVQDDYKYGGRIHVERLLFVPKGKHPYVTEHAFFDKKKSCPKITQACSAWLCFRPSRHNFELSPICCEAQAIPPAQAYRVNCWPLPKNKKSFFLEKKCPKKLHFVDTFGMCCDHVCNSCFFNRKKMLSHAQVARRYHRSNLHRMTPLSN